MVEIVKNRPQELTRAELEIMQVFWRQGACVVHAILDALEEPKPAYNTVSTIVRILEKKGYVGHKAYGKTYEYYPLVPKEEYAKTVVSSILNSYFDGSLAQMVSFFSRREDLSIQETEQILAIIRQARHKTDKS